MKRIVKALAVLVVALAGVMPCRAQYYEIANQLPSLLSPALSGSMNYKGYVEVSGLAGVGDNRANFVGVSTSQGFRYSSWFFMGVGVGVDVARGAGDVVLADGGPDYDSYWHETSRTKAMIPVFTDFRFNIGDQSRVGVFCDLKLGAAWLIGGSYLQLSDRCLTTSTQFYFRPTIGVRIPVNSARPTQAVNIGVTYQLLTGNNNYWGDNRLTLNNIGVTLGYEW